MALVAMSPGKFEANNVVLQNNLIKITFPLATDKTNYDTSLSAITYQIRYKAQPIYCSGTESNYIYKDTADSITTTDWTVITNIIGENGKGTTRMRIPSYDKDSTIQYEIRALDDYKPTGPITTSSSFFCITNKPTEIKVSSLDWSEDNNVRVTGNIINTGFSIPGNYSAIKASSDLRSQWQKWRADLVTIFGNIRFDYTYKYGLTSETTSEEVNTGAGFNLLTTDWITNDVINFLIINEEIEPDVQTFNPNNSYYFKIYLVTSGVSIPSNSVLNTVRNPNTLTIMLLSIVPIIQLLKGCVKVGIPESNLAKTGGLMASHGVQQIVSSDPELGHSIALYDHHVPLGGNAPKNEPSIGFFDVNNNLLSKIQIKTISGLNYLMFNNKQGNSYGFRLNSSGELEYYNGTTWETFFKNNILTNDDYNNAIKPGFYTMINCANAPISGGITSDLIVTLAGDDIDQKVQYEDHVYVRSRVSNVWGAWVDLSVDPDLFELIEKKLDKTGGTINGNLNVTGNLQKSSADVITTSGGTITGATNFTGALQKSSADVITTSGGTITGATNFTGALQQGDHNVTTVNDFKAMSMSNIKFGWRRINDDFISGGTVVPTQLLAQYSKVGNMVFFSIDAIIPITSNESAQWQAVIFDLPFTVKQICSAALGRSANCFIDAGGAVVYNPTAIVADKKIYFFDQTGVNQIRWRPTAPKYLNLSGFAYI